MPGELPQVTIFTDGACSGNPGPGGWAFIVRYADDAEIEGSGGEPQTTNNRMEMLAAIRGIETLEERSAIDLYSDSQYLVKGIAEWMDGWKKKGWKRGKNQPLKNLELWQRLDELRTAHAITPHWVRGHNDHPENERCDQLAVAAVEVVRAEAAGGRR